MTNIKIFSATEARKKWFEILNWVNIYNTEVLIKKNKRIVVKLIPGNAPSLDDIDEVIKKTYGRLAGKKTFFPYEDKRIIKKEKKANNLKNYGW